MMKYFEINKYAHSKSKLEWCSGGSGGYGGYGESCVEINFEGYDDQYVHIEVECSDVDRTQIKNISIPIRSLKEMLLEIEQNE